MARTKTPITLVFDMDAETPNTVRFQEQHEGDRSNRIMGKVYVKKTQLTKWGNPKQIEVTVTPK